MHELGVMIEAVKTVEKTAEAQGVTQVASLVLQIGELSSVIPKYVEDCYPAAVDGTLLEDAELRIEVLPGNARCKKCGEVYRVIENRKKCPSCRSRRKEILCGKEFIIKEIVAC